MYTLAMNTLTNSVSVTDRIKNNLKHWYEVAAIAIHSFHGQVGEFEDCVHDVWMSFEKKRRIGRTDAYMPNDAEADCVIATTIRSYAKNAKYRTNGLSTDQRENEKSVVKGFVSFEEVSDCIEDGDIHDSFDKAEMRADYVASMRFVKAWDKLNNEGELTCEQKLAYIKEMSKVYVTLNTDAERTALVSTVRDLLDLGPDSPRELYEAFVNIIRNKAA